MGAWTLSQSRKRATCPKFIVSNSQTARLHQNRHRTSLWPILDLRAGAIPFSCPKKHVTRSFFKRPNDVHRGWWLNDGIGGAAVGSTVYCPQPSTVLVALAVCRTLQAASEDRNDRPEAPQKSLQIHSYPSFLHCLCFFERTSVKEMRVSTRLARDFESGCLTPDTSLKIQAPPNNLRDTGFSEPRACPKAFQDVSCYLAPIWTKHFSEQSRARIIQPPEDLFDMKYFLQAFSLHLRHIVTGFCKDSRDDSWGLVAETLKLIPNFRDSLYAGSKTCNLVPKKFGKLHRRIALCRTCAVHIEYAKLYWMDSRHGIISRSLYRHTLSESVASRRGRSGSHRNSYQLTLLILVDVWQFESRLCTQKMKQFVSIWRIFFVLAEDDFIFPIDNISFLQSQSDCRLTSWILYFQALNKRLSFLLSGIALLRFGHMLQRKRRRQNGVKQLVPWAKVQVT